MKLWYGVRVGVIAISLPLNASSVANTNASDQKATIAVDEIFADLARPGSPGCALGVYRDGQMIYAKGYGFANLEENIAITPQTVFDIGSTSKQFTAASILLLEKQGKLSLNDDVRRYIPELPDYGYKITILNLLNHTSGLRDYLTLIKLAGINLDSVTTEDYSLAMIVRQKAFNFPPGSDWLYSNTGYSLLSVIVSRVSGKTLHEFAAENIFVPLGMGHTQFRNDHTTLIPNRALAYAPKEKSEGYVLDVSYFEGAGDGGVHTSIEDLQKWDENFYNARIGGKDFVGEMQERAKLNNGKVLDYTKGLRIEDYRGLRTVSHGGAWQGYRAQLLRFPGEHFTVACLCNVENANPFKRARRVADVYLGSVMKPSQPEKDAGEAKEESKNDVTLTAGQLQSYAGDYRSDEVGVSYELRIKDRRLKLIAVLDFAGLPRLNNFRPNELQSLDADKFKLGGDGVTIKFQRDAAGKVTGFTLDAGRTTGIIFTRQSASQE